MGEGGGGLGVSNGNPLNTTVHICRMSPTAAKVVWFGNIFPGQGPLSQMLTPDPMVPLGKRALWRREILTSYPSGTRVGWGWLLSFSRLCDHLYVRAISSRGGGRSSKDSCLDLCRLSAPAISCVSSCVSVAGVLYFPSHNGSYPESIE